MGTQCKLENNQNNNIMKQINNVKSQVFLSTYDDSDLLLPVSEEHKDIKNVCVAVKFGDIVIKISPKNTCKCTWYDAMNEHREKLMHPAYWQMAGSVHREVNQALRMLGHEPIRDVWADTEDNDPEYSGYYAWRYNGTYGYMLAINQYYSYSVRATLAFQL